MRISELIEKCGLSLHEKTERDSSVKIDQAGQAVVFSQVMSFITVGIYETGKEVKFFHVDDNTQNAEIVNLRNAIYDVIATF